MEKFKNLSGMDIGTVGQSISIAHEYVQNRILFQQRI